MRKETYKNYIRVTKRTAEKAYNNGLQVLLAPVNANLYYLMSPTPIFGVFVNNTSGNDFYNVVNNFEYYNCIGSIGHYAKYFIEEN